MSQRQAFVARIISSNISLKQDENSVANARAIKPAAVKRPFQDSTNSNASRDVQTFKKAAAEVAATTQGAAARPKAVQAQPASETEEKADVCSLIDAVDVEFSEGVDAAAPQPVVAEAVCVDAANVALLRSSPAVSRSAVSEDVQKVAEYASSIFVYMISHEESFRPLPSYLEKHVEVNFKMRRILCDWLHEVHYKFRLLPETFFLMINYVDRFLSEKTEYCPIPQSLLLSSFVASLTLRSVSRVNLQLVGVSCLMVASK